MKLNPWSQWQCIMLYSAIHSIESSLLSCPPRMRRRDSEWECSFRRLGPHKSIPIYDPHHPNQRQKALGIRRVAGCLNNEQQRKRLSGNSKAGLGDMVTWKANLFENMLKVIASAGMFLVIDSLSLSLWLTCQQTGFSHLAEGEENADCRKTRASCKETQKEDAPRGFEGAQARNISPRNEQALTDSDLVHLSWNVVPAQFLPTTKPSTWSSRSWIKQNWNLIFGYCRRKSKAGINCVCICAWWVGRQIC